MTYTLHYQREEDTPYRESIAVDSLWRRKYLGIDDIDDIVRVITIVHEKRVDDEDDCWISIHILHPEKENLEVQDSIKKQVTFDRDMFLRYYIPFGQDEVGYKIDTPSRGNPIGIKNHHPYAYALLTGRNICIFFLSLYLASGIIEKIGYHHLISIRILFEEYKSYGFLRKLPI